MAGKGNGIALRAHRTTTGETVWLARIIVKYTGPDGQLATRRIERGTGTGDRRKARAIAKAIQDEWAERAYRRLPDRDRPLSFAAAALSYMRTTGNTRYVAPLLQHFEERALIMITQDALLTAAEALYPSCAAATINRQVFTPVIAIMHHAAKSGATAPALTRPAGYDRKAPLCVPTDDWFERLLPHCAPPLAALVLAYTLHGRRTQEFLNATPADFDAATQGLSIGHTKTGEPLLIRLSPPVVAALQRYDWRAERYLFHYHTRGCVYKELHRACAAAGIAYFAPTHFGRHKFATRLLQQGKSLKFVKEAGRWASIKMPAERYGHLEHSEVDGEVAKFNEEWAARLTPRTRIQEVK